ncbi:MULTISPECIES: hypothetical protein [unclassified Haloferax]|uniref:hypothetical protein n=1 Tax=unclassified Haloferax TaxID=2625095 RepID=UPI0011C0659D|nr:MULTISPECIES: hypothetical protein [unclassified Haloferax]
MGATVTALLCLTPNEFARETVSVFVVWDMATGRVWIGILVGVVCGDDLSERVALEFTDAVEVRLVVGRTFVVSTSSSVFSETKHHLK